MIPLSASFDSKTTKRAQCAYPKGAGLSAQWKGASARTPNLARLQRQAIGALHDGHLDKAERLCAAILEYSSDHFDTLHLTGFIHLQRGRHAEAIGFLTKAVKANAASVDAASNLGLAFQGVGRFEEAITQYRNALALSPRHPEILYNLGNAYLALDRIMEALASYDEALAANPSHVGARVNRGNTLLRFNRPADALESYDQALALMPDHPQILTNRGHALAPARPAAGGAGEFRGRAHQESRFPRGSFRVRAGASDARRFRGGLESL